MPPVLDFFGVLLDRSRRLTGRQIDKPTGFEISRAAFDGTHLLAVRPDMITLAHVLTIHLDSGTAGGTRFRA